MEGMILNNRYELKNQAGLGGVGIVYQAYDTILQRTVAVKVLNQTGLDSAGQARLLHEARAAAQLDHPNIVTVYDVGQADGVPFLVMEWVDGDSLYDRPPETLEEALNVARQVCAALEHAHNHGIVHRDLKPENVLVGLDGVVRLTDFGLARSASRLSVEDGLVGTIAYMAPEQALGQTVDVRADLYSLGVLLYELATGGPLFQADDPFALITQHLHAPVVPPRAKNPLIPTPLNALILALLAKQPTERPASAAAVGTELGVIAQALEPGMEVVSPPGLEIPPPTPVAFLERIVRGQLVGRKTELALMREYWRRVRDGNGQLILLSGEPGIGKTRLVQELATQVQVQGGQALTGASYPEQLVPFGPFAQLVMQVFSRYPTDSLGLSDFNLAELIRLAPPLQGRFPGIPPNPDLGEPKTARYRMFTGVVTLCKELALQTPLLLVLEDLHWADEGTLALLLHLARATRELPILMLVTYRETDLEDNPFLQNTLRELDRSRLGQRVKLDRLDQAETNALLNALFGEAITPDFLEGIYQQTEGVPFFVEEVCKALVESGQVYYAEGRWHRPEDINDLAIPQSVQAALQRRVARLSPKTRELLTAAAVLGRVFDYELLVVVSSAGEDEIIAALEAAEAAQLVREESGSHGGTFEFTHALVPRTLAEGLSGMRRRRLYQKVGENLASLRPQETARIAHNFWQAENPAGVPYLQKAGDQAAAQHANADAVQWYSRALGLVPEVEYEQRFALLFAREKVYDLLGNRAAQKEDLSQMAVLASNLGAMEQAKIALRQANYALFTSDYAQTVNHAHVALELARQMGALELATSAHWIWGSAYYYQGHYLDAKEQYEKGLVLTQESGDQRQMGNCLIGLGNVANDQGDYAAARWYYEQALGIFQEIGERERETVTLNNLGVMTARQGDYALAQKYHEQSLAISQEIGKRNAEGVNLVFLGAVAWHRGDNTAAKEFFEEALAISKEMGARVWVGISLANLGAVAANQENHAIAKGYCEQALAIFKEIGSGGGWCWNHLGALALGENNLPLAENCYQQALAINQGKSQSQYLAEDWAGLAKLKLAQGDRESARGYAEKVRGYLQENPRLAGAIYPMRAFHFLWDVWSALDETALADEVLSLAAALLQDYLDKNPDSAAQEMFLRQPHHAVLWQAWQDKKAAVKVPKIIGENRSFFK